MLKILIFVLINTISFGKSLMLHEQIINKLDTYRTDKELIDDIKQYLYKFSKENNIIGLKRFKEKEKYYKKTEHRRAILKFVKGYLGAFFNSNMNKDPYAYAFILNHSKGKVLRDYIKNNELNKRKVNLQKGDFSKNFFSNYHHINKTNNNTYQVLIQYSIDSYKNFKKEKTITATSKIVIELDSNKTNFYPYVTELKSNYRQQ